MRCDVIQDDNASKVPPNLGLINPKGLTLESLDGRASSCFVDQGTKSNPTFGVVQVAQGRLTHNSPSRKERDNNREERDSRASFSSSVARTSSQTSVPQICDSMTRSQKISNLCDVASPTISPPRRSRRRRKDGDNPPMGEICRVSPDIDYVYICPDTDSPPCKDPAALSDDMYQAVNETSEPLYALSPVPRRNRKPHSLAHSPRFADIGAIGSDENGGSCRQRERPAKESSGSYTLKVSDAPSVQERGSQIAFDRDHLLLNADDPVPLLDISWESAIRSASCGRRAAKTLGRRSAASDTAPTDPVTAAIAPGKVATKEPGRCQSVGPWVDLV